MRDLSERLRAVEAASGADPGGTLATLAEGRTDSIIAGLKAMDAADGLEFEPIDDAGRADILNRVRVTMGLPRLEPA